LNQAIRIWVRRPNFFSDLKTGDSIAVNGACLTLEQNLLSPNVNASICTEMQFTIGYETLSILKKKQTSDWLSQIVNLERSIRFGDRIHGHLVTGHVEDIGKITKSEPLGENWMIDVQIPQHIKTFCWRKGSLTVNGTSLTINQVSSNTVEHCLIPETQKRTNLSMLKVGDSVNLEPDSSAKAIFEMFNKFLNPELIKS
jgi:riboflavin synthase